MMNTKERKWKKLRQPKSYQRSLHTFGRLKTIQTTAVARKYRPPVKETKDQEVQARLTLPHNHIDDLFQAQIDRDGRIGCTRPHAYNDLMLHPEQFDTIKDRAYNIALRVMKTDHDPGTIRWWNMMVQLMEEQHSIRRMLERVMDLRFQDEAQAGGCDTEDWIALFNNEDIIQQTYDRLWEIAKCNHKPRREETIRESDKEMENEEA